MLKAVTDSIRYLKGIGPARAGLLARSGIKTVEDLLYYFPRRYEDRTNLIPVCRLKAGEVSTVKARIETCSQRRSFRRRNFSITEARVNDGTGRLYCVWFNQPYLQSYFKPGQELILYGKVDNYAGRLQMSAPEFELLSGEDDSLDSGRITPVYTLPEGITQRYFRRIVHSCLDGYLSQVEDFLPYDIRSRLGMTNLAKGIRNMHFPEAQAAREEAYRRLSFDNFFLFQIPIALRKLRSKEKPGIAHGEGRLLADFISNLPFRLTRSQEKVISEIKADMQRPLVMHRLLQGDVGCGKTVVAACACLIAIQGGYQAAFLVPTEILAKQHLAKLSSLFAAARINVRLGFLSGSLSNREKEGALRRIGEGKFDLVIGTHALLDERVSFKKLGLVVIDEQHKFGVAQRALLPQKGPDPDVLIMTATPIPRTLAITVYADLDISVINELPAGRKPVKTIRISQEKRPWLYDFIRTKAGEGRQAYVVYPLIEESYALDLLSAKKMYAEFRDKVFKSLNVALIHGKMKEEEQDRIMASFKAGGIDILITTTVLEVGIDVPNAAVMVIEHAERFGLSQLHQLRGRIGRGAEEAFCILVSTPSTGEAEARLAAMVKYTDGFRIAEEDLKIRGPGQFFGTRQHGSGELKIGDPVAQVNLLKIAREEAARLVSGDRRLEAKEHRLLRNKLFKCFPGYEKLVMVS